MPSIWHRRFRLLEQSLLLCQAEQTDLQVQSIHRIISIAQSLLECIPTTKDSGEKDVVEREEMKVEVKSSNTREASVVSDHLPVEILLCIFRLYRDENTTTSFTSLMGVCRWWRDIVLGHPDLWSRIDIVPTGLFSNFQWYYGHIELCLKRSGNLPLDITVDFSRIEWIPEHLYRVLEVFIPPGHQCNLNLYGACHDLLIKYSGQLLHILDLLTEIPLSSTASNDALSPENILRLEAHDLEGKVAPAADGLIIRWQSLQLTLPSLPLPEILNDISLVLRGRMPSLKQLKITSGLEVYKPFAWPQSETIYFESLHQIYIDSFIDLKSLPCNPLALRDLTIPISSSSLAAIRQFTSLERLTFYGSFYSSSLISDLAPLFFPRLKHLTVETSAYELSPATFYVPSLQKLTIVFNFYIKKVKSELLSTIKTLELAPMAWMARPSDAQVSPPTRAYDPDYIIPLTSVLASCAMLENLRILEPPGDPKGCILVKKIISSILTGILDKLCIVTFLQLAPDSEDIEDAIEVASYNVSPG